MITHTDVQEIPLSAIRDDERCSPRITLSRGQIKTFAQIMRERGAPAFPPLVLVGPREDGSYAIADGRHRVAAAREAKAASFPAVTVPWTTERELFALSLRLSSQNGVALTQPEKRRAVLRLLGEFPECSTREIAEMAGTSHNLVFLCRKLLQKGPVPERKRYQRKSAEDHAAAILAVFDALGATAENLVDLSRLPATLAWAAGQRYAAVDPVREMDVQIGLLERARALLQAAQERARSAAAAAAAEGSVI